ncbi:HTH_Tnp_Tc3_2 domain-containing protein [Trichonephila clavipes]|uniref:HTH_Tnp_Tc3_2 domain-containing protein n=1 Tax=Trichonephila clavipes TaxID=2585209 RepID=A0A8X6UYA3_TRICX|nr:HTH_Tnp_Tc3_2 domain-containing protein [Trichonephila clavipes]
MTTRKDHHLFIFESRNRDVTSSKLSRELFVATRTLSFRGTVSRRLHERSLSARPVIRVSLSSTNRSVHLKWFRNYKYWIMDQWRPFASLMNPGSA